MQGFGRISCRAFVRRAFLHRSSCRAPYEHLQEPSGVLVLRIRRAFKLRRKLRVKLRAFQGANTVAPPVHCMLRLLCEQSLRTQGFAQSFIRRSFIRRPSCRLRVRPYVEFPMDGCRRLLVYYCYVLVGLIRPVESLGKASSALGGRLPGPICACMLCPPHGQFAPWAE